jgi:hypothetical protein
MMQNGGGSLTPPPGTGGVSNGGRTPSERGDPRSQSSDISEDERKKEGWESVAVRVCCFWVSTGGFYRHGRARELGFPEGGRGGVWRRAMGKAGRGGLGSVLAGCGLGIGALWAGVGEFTPVGIVQRGRGKREGVRAFSPCLPCLTARVRAGEAGAR